MSTACSGGVACGLAAAFALTRLLSGFLTGVSETDPLTYLAVSSCLGLVAMVAGIFRRDGQRAWTPWWR